MPDETKPIIKIPTILAEIVSEIYSTDPESFPPQDGVSPTERVITTVTEEFPRRVWSTMSFYRRESARAAIDAKFSGDSISHALRLSQKADLLKEVFWWFVRETNAGWTDDFVNIGMRKGWVIVKCAPANPMENLKGFFEGLGG